LPEKQKRSVWRCAVSERYTPARYQERMIPMFNIFNLFTAKRDGDKMFKLYERALNTANKYLPIKLGPGNAKLASAMLNDILSDDVFRGNGVETFRAENRQSVKQKVQNLLVEDPMLREVMAKTLWVKWLLDKAFNRTPSVTTLENSWAYQTYSSDYAMPTLKEYETLVETFERRMEYELGKYLIEHSRGGQFETN
jgi:hypothetical protein